MMALARPFGMTLPGIKKHIGVLEHSGIVTCRRQGRTALAFDGDDLKQTRLELLRKTLLHLTLQRGGIRPARTAHKAQHGQYNNTQNPRSLFHS